MRVTFERRNCETQTTKGRTSGRSLLRPRVNRPSLTKHVWGYCDHPRRLCGFQLVTRAETGSGKESVGDDTTRLERTSDGVLAGTENERGVLLGRRATVLTGK